MIRRGLAALAFAVALLTPLAVRAQPVPESVYPPPEPTFYDDPREEQTGFRFAIETRYMTDYIWRGIERFDAGRSEDEANLQFDAKLGFDLGKLPHPYASLFVNVADNDPVSDFQEIRPEVGFDWNIRPLTISAGYTSYIFPDREEFDTTEVFARLVIDDSVFFHTERPVLSPYAFAAYDFDTFEGLYAEVGVQHELPIENTGLTFIFNGHVAYVNGFDLFSINGPTFGEDVDDDDVSGLQHWQVGVTARYTLNQLLNIPDRFGKISVVGYLNYTDSIDDELEASNQLWGGAGIALRF